MYTFEIIGNEHSSNIAGILFLASIVWFVVWFFTVGGREFVNDSDRSAGYREFTIGSSIILAITIFLCDIALTFKRENVPLKATYVSHTVMADSKMFLAIVQLEDGTLVHVEPHPSIKISSEPFTVYWNKQ